MKPRNVGGRPSLGAKAKSVVVPVRFSANELDAIRGAMSRDGASAMSTWVRALVLRALGIPEDKPEPKVVDE